MTEPKYSAGRAQVYEVCATELQEFIAARPEPTELERACRAAAEVDYHPTARALLLQAADALKTLERELVEERELLKRSVSTRHIEQTSRALAAVAVTVLCMHSDSIEAREWADRLDAALATTASAEQDWKDPDCV